MVALTGINVPHAGECAWIQPLIAPPPGLELPEMSEVPAKVVLAEKNDVFAYTNAVLCAGDARLMQQYAEHRLALENAALRKQVQMKMAAAAPPWSGTAWAKPVSFNSPISTEPPSDEDDDDDEVVIISESDDDVGAEDEEVSLDKNADVIDTTVLMRNVPRSFTRKDLMHLLDKEGFSCKYTFLYLPFNFGNGNALGYAFVNLESDQVCQDFLNYFHGFVGWGVADANACYIEKTKDQQGLDANIDRYRNSPVMHEMVPDVCKPVILANGVRLDFPLPTVVIRLPPRRLLVGNLAQRA